MPVKIDELVDVNIKLSPDEIPCCHQLGCRRPFAMYVSSERWPTCAFHILEALIPDYNRMPEADKQYLTVLYEDWVS